VKIYAIREHWDYEIHDLIEFFGLKEDAEARAAELNQDKYSVYSDYEVEEVTVK
jgi:hypothetical protein